MYKDIYIYPDFDSTGDFPPCFQDFNNVSIMRPSFSCVNRHDFLTSEASINSHSPATEQAEDAVTRQGRVW